MKSSATLLLASLAVTRVLAQEQLTFPCSPLHFVFAREATEQPQNYNNFEEAAGKVWSHGYGAAGYSLFSNLTTLVSGTTGYPIHWPAQLEGPKGIGSADASKHISRMASICPQQRYALGGFSYGAYPAFETLPKLSEDVRSRVIAIVAFGSPIRCPSGYSESCRNYCHRNDNLCESDGKNSNRGGKGGLFGGISRAVKRSPQPQTTDEPQINCNFNVQEKGHVPKQFGNESPHSTYNKDGYYIKAAACFIADRYNKAVSRL